MNTHGNDLPPCWGRPHRDLQRTLFSRDAEEVLAELKVSTSDMDRWYKLGWVSFPLSESKVLEQPQENEVRFIRNLARSGLSDSQINQLLQGLPKPYAFTGDVAYHFEHGWVSPSYEDPHDVVAENVDDWLNELAASGQTERLSEIACAISDLLKQEEDESEQAK